LLSFLKRLLPFFFPKDSNGNEKESDNHSNADVSNSGNNKASSSNPSAGTTSSSVLDKKVKSTSSNPLQKPLVSDGVTSPPFPKKTSPPPVDKKVSLTEPSQQTEKPTVGVGVTSPPFPKKTSPPPVDKKVSLTEPSQQTEKPTVGVGVTSPPFSGNVSSVPDKPSTSTFSNPTQPMITMKKCPKTGEPMQEVVVLGERIDVSSAGCYFDRGELTRILGSKPGFLRATTNKILGIPDPLSRVDQTSSIIEIEQNIVNKKRELSNYRLGSPEYDKAYQEYKNLLNRKDALS